MGITCADLIECIDFQDGAPVGVIVRLHFGVRLIDSPAPLVPLTDYRAALTAAAASETAAAAALATLWGSWWSALTAPTRDMLAEAVHLRAAGSQAYP
jgi:hypothetical protein